MDIRNSSVPWKKGDFGPISVGLYSDNNLAFLGGGEIIIIDLGNFLSRAGLNVTIFDDSNGNDLKRVDENTLDGMISAKYSHTPYENHGWLKFLYHPMPRIEVLSSRDVNLIFVHRVPSPGYLKKVSCIRSRVALCFHGIGIQEQWPLNPIIRLYQLYARFALKRISGVVNASDNIFFHVLTSSSASILYSNGIRDDRVVEIANGIDPGPYKVGRNDSRFTVLFMGRMNDLQKGIRRLRKVVQILGKSAPEIEINAIGSGPDAFILNHEYNENFHYKGYVDGAMKADLLSMSNLLIVTSNMDPFPLVCLEGLFSGLPIVTTSAAGPSNMISSIQDAGKVSGFKSARLASDVLEYYQQWKQNKEIYYNRKIARSSAAKEKLNVDMMNDNYRKFIETLYYKGEAIPSDKNINK